MPYLPSLRIRTTRKSFNMAFFHDGDGPVVRPQITGLVRYYPNVMHRPATIIRKSRFFDICNDHSK
jgi:hypothetical protein